MDDTDDFLRKIAQIESSGGKNYNHQEIQSGLQKGQTAIGKYGLLPNTVDEVINRSKDPQLSILQNMEPSEQKSYLETHPQMEDTVAHYLADHVLSNQGGDQEKAAYAWNHGHNLTPAKIENRDYQDSDYVKKFNKLSSSISPTNSTPSSLTQTFRPPVSTPMSIDNTDQGQKLQQYMGGKSLTDNTLDLNSQQKDDLKGAMDTASKPIWDEADPDRLNKVWDYLEQNKQKANKIYENSPQNEQEQSFMAQNFNPIQYGLENGGMMGGVGNAAEQETVPVLNKVKQFLAGKGAALPEAAPNIKPPGMFQAAGYQYPADNTAQAIKIRDALRQLGLDQDPGNIINKIK